MKQYLTTALTLLCVALIVTLVVMERDDNAQQQADAGAMASFSNRLDTAHTQIAIYEGATIVLSNRLDQSQSAWLSFSNQVMNGQSLLALEGEQITNLTRQVAALALENQALPGLHQRVRDLTHQVAGLTRQLASARAGLVQANRNYGRLENRLRRDVAERLVVERKFHNLRALKRQIENIQENPAEPVSAESIYAGLGVEVKSNEFYVISPN